ncbi:hypothetical protein [Marinicauda sp. Alg238-R41]|jgi:hypothetical protein|nr:hypothetical protein [Marinicauda sp. Alg238-R41]
MLTLLVWGLLIAAFTVSLALAETEAPASLDYAPLVLLAAAGAMALVSRLFSR